MAAALRVLVAVPLIGRDAGQVVGWREALERVAAAAAPGATFALCAAVRASDGEAARACADARVRVLRVGDYAVGPGRHNYVGVMLKRVRLVREAVETSAQVIWFVDADVRPAPEDWAAAEALLRAGTPVVVIPCPVRWARGALVVCISDGGGRPALCDARRLVAADGGDSVPILGGGMGCTAIATAVAARVRFRVAEFALPDGDGAIAGEDMGWFLNARAEGVEVRLPLGRAARHVGAPWTPEPLPAARWRSGAPASGAPAPPG